VSEKNRNEGVEKEEKSQRKQKSIMRGIFVTERAGTPFRKFFLRMAHIGTASRNYFLLASI
jgi:hypothetical protein